MRILFITEWFHPEPGFFLGLPFAAELVRRGHEVEVLTGFPNYPDGKIYDGYKLRPILRETIDGVSIIRVPLYPSHDRSPVRRLLTYASFALSAGAIAPFAAKSADLVYVFIAPPTIALPALVLNWLRGTPFVTEIQDLWPDTAQSTGWLRNQTAIRLVNMFLRWVYSKSSRIVVLAPGFKEKLVERDVPPEKVEVILNWCDEKNIYPLPRDQSLSVELGLSERFNVLFAGNMGAAQALLPVIDAAMLVEERFPAIQFVFMGGGVDLPLLKEKCEELGLSNVRFLPKRPISEVSPVLSLADVLLVHLRDDPLFEFHMPGKTQAYLAVGRPVLMAVRGYASALITDIGAGLGCTPGDPRSIADAVLQLYEVPEKERTRMGERGRRFYEEDCSMKVGVERYEEVFRAAIREHQSVK
jgi:colanic acid biosynthesis glycosyl transferase WcaI